MLYILTLLKDLPNYPKGTQFRYQSGYEHGMFNMGCIRKTYSMGTMDTPTDKLKEIYLIPKSIIDDPEWIKKEIDHSTSIDLKCPICGETKGHMIVCGMQLGNKDDGYYNDADVYFEYDCGHELRKLYDC